MSEGMTVQIPLLSSLWALTHRDNEGRKGGQHPPQPLRVETRHFVSGMNRGKAKEWKEKKKRVEQVEVKKRPWTGTGWSGDTISSRVFKPKWQEGFIGQRNWTDACTYATLSSGMIGRLVYLLHVYFPRGSLTLSASVSTNKMNIFAMFFYVIISLSCFSGISYSRHRQGPPLSSVAHLLVTL